MHKNNWNNKQNPFGNFTWNDLSETLENFLDQSGIADFFGGDAEHTEPPVNVYEHKDKLEIELAAPGLAKADFNIQVEDDQLIISTKKDVKNHKESVKVKRKEFDYSTFKRSFRLSDRFDSQRITAKYENGILLITVPNKNTEEKDTIHIKVL